MEKIMNKDFSMIKVFNNFISKEDSKFLINWTDANAEDQKKFRHRTGVAYNKGLAVRCAFPDEKPPFWFKELKEIVDKYSKKFIDTVKDNYDITEELYFYGVSITRLSEDIQLRIHKDVHNDFSSLSWSCVVYLNDDYKDGEVAFVKDLDKNKFPTSEYDPNFHLYVDGEEAYVYKPIAGDAIVFPADQWHGGRQITKGTKYALILWLVREKEYSFEGFDSDRVLSLINYNSKPVVDSNTK